MYLKNDNENDSPFPSSPSLSLSFFLSLSKSKRNNDASSMIYNNNHTIQTRCITTTAYANDINYFILYARLTRKHPAFPFQFLGLSFLITIQIDIVSLRKNCLIVLQRYARVTWTVKYDSSHIYASTFKFVNTCNVSPLLTNSSKKILKNTKCYTRAKSFLEQ